MKQYNDSFRLWEDCQSGAIQANFIKDGIWKVTETDSGESGFVFSDETENFHPTIFETFEKAVEGRQRYCETELGMKVVVADLGISL